MSGLEEEIIERFRQLAPENRVRILSTLQEEVLAEHLSLAAWLAEAEMVQIVLRPDASGYTPTASALRKGI